MNNIGNILGPCIYRRKCHHHVSCCSIDNSFNDRMPWANSFYSEMLHPLQRFIPDAQNYFYCHHLPFRAEGYFRCLCPSHCPSAVHFTLSARYLATDLIGNHQICTKHAPWDALGRYWKCGWMILPLKVILCILYQNSNKWRSTSLLYSDLGRASNGARPIMLFYLLGSLDSFKFYIYLTQNGHILLHYIDDHCL